MAQVQLNMAITDGFQLFLFLFFAQLLAYSVHCFAPLLRSFSFFCFWVYFALTFTFSLVPRTSFMLLSNHYEHLGKYVHLFIRTNHARNTTAVNSLR